MLLKKRGLTTVINAEIKLILRKKTWTMKKGYYCFLSNFQSIISLHVLKLALNKSMHASDDEQGINKLWPKEDLIKIELIRALPKSRVKNSLEFSCCFSFLCQLIDSEKKTRW